MTNRRLRALRNLAERPGTVSEGILAEEILARLDPTYEKKTSEGINRGILKFCISAALVAFLLVHPLFQVRVPGPGGSPAAVTATPTMIQWASSSSTTANATGTTLNSCPTHAYCYYLPNATLTANAITGAVQFNNTPSSTPTVTDDQSNTYTVIATANDTTNGRRVAIFRAVNIAAGTRKITITFSSDVDHVSAMAAEFNQVATSSPDDGSGTNTSASGSSTMSAGAITPGSANDLLVQCGARTQTPKAASFTAGSQSNITWGLLSTDTIDGLVCQWGQYTVTSSITPQLTMGSNSGYASAAIALKTASTGNARPAGMRIIGIAHFNEPTGTSSLVWQVPSNGANLIVGSFGFGGSAFTTSSLADTSTNTWTHSSLGQKGDGSSGKSDMWYAANITGTNGLIITNTTTGTASDYTALIYTIQSAATSPFVNAYSHLRASLTTSNIPYAPMFGYQLPPGFDSGISIGNLQQGFNTSQSITGPCTTFDATTFGGETLSGGGTNPPDENNAWWHCDHANGNTAGYSIGQADGATSLSSAAFGVAFFKSATATLTPIFDTNFTSVTNVNPMRTADQVLFTPQDSASGFLVTSASAQPNSQTFDDGVLWTGGGSTVTSFPNDQFAQCTLGTMTGTGVESGIGVFLRAATAANTGYRIVASAKTTTPNVWLARIVTGTYTLLASGFKGSAWTSGDVVWAQVQGSVIKVRNGSGGSDLISFTDGTPITSGIAGIAFSSSMTASSCTAIKGGPL